MIEDLRNKGKALSKREFETCIDEYFVTLRSDGSEIELIPGGKSIQVTQDNLDEYITLVIDARLNES